jgi:perosamine synthetase
MEEKAAVRPLRSGWITQGPEVAAFEKEFAAFTGADHACAVSNCTNALHMALLAVGVQPGDEVITVSHSFVATANSIRYCGAIPVFVDIEPDTFNLDCSLIEAAVTSKTSAILCVHQMGMPCRLPEVLAVAHRHGLRVVEDAACASGSEIEINGKWERVGKPHGDVACFSFHPRKVITTGDGGMLTTKNSHWDAQFRLLRQHGMSVPDTVRHNASSVIFESYPLMGYNYRMTDIQAAVGREQLAKLPMIVERRRRLADRYQILLQEVPELILPVDAVWTRSNWQSYCVRLPQHVPQLAVMQGLLEAGIATRRGIMCAHREPAYRNQGPSVGRKGSSLIQSERAQDEAILLPMYAQMTNAEQDRVVDCLIWAVGRER